MTAVFIDSTVLAYAAGRQHPDRASARAVLDAARHEQLRLHTSVEAIQEFVHHRMRMGAPSAVEEARLIQGLCVLHPFDEAVLDRALDLIGSSGVRGRDAVHAATALGSGFSRIVSHDRAFDTVPGLRRMPPAALFVN